MSFEPTPSKSPSPEAIARLVGGHREFLAFLEQRVESRAPAEDILQSAFARGLERGAGKALRLQVEQACGTCAEHGCFDCHCKARTGSHCESASA